MSTFTLTTDDFPRLRRKADPLARPIEVSTQVRKNLNQALRGHSAIEAAGRCVADYLNQTPERRAQIDKILDRMELLEIVTRCLIQGQTLAEAGATGPCSTPSQRRAWAAGQLKAAISALAVAGQFIDILHQQQRETSEALFRARYANQLRAREKAAFEADKGVKKVRDRRSSTKVEDRAELK